MKAKFVLRTVLAGTVVLAALPAVAQPAAAPAAAVPSSSLRCVDVQQIKDTASRDGGKTLSFSLRDGTTLVNHLRQQCNGLAFGGFAWVTPPDGRICENAQTLRTLETGELCRLGKFDAPVKRVSAQR